MLYLEGKKMNLKSVRHGETGRLLDQTEWLEILVAFQIYAGTITLHQGMMIVLYTYHFRYNIKIRFSSVYRDKPSTGTSPENARLHMLIWILKILFHHYFEYSPLRFFFLEAKEEKQEP
ncbi:hypothetical protein ACJX0J_036313 [Zea mays]